LRALTKLECLYLSGTPVADLTPLAALERLEVLSVDSTQNLNDLRPIAHLEGLSNGVLYYAGCAAVDLDPTPGGLQDLVKIEDHEERTTKTLAYLRAQKTWPPVAAPPSAPSPHRAPLMVTWEGDRLVRAPLAPEVEADPARLLQQALAALRNRLADLATLRTTLSNQRPGLARAFSGLDLALTPDLAEINQIDIGEQILRIASLLPAPGDMLDDQLEDLFAFVDAAQRLARRLPDWVAISTVTSMLS
ncbi:MAG: leucine-rich repeat domain-containing protein, partial [Pseudomonadota bacterium]